MSCFSVYAQFSPKIYAGLQGFYNKRYEDNLYAGFEAGAEILQYNFLALEICVKYYAGSPNEFESLNFTRICPGALLNSAPVSNHLSF